MQVTEAIKRRRSVRIFTDDGVTSEQVQTLVEAANAAPSAGNKQAWHLVVVQNPELKSRIAEEAAGQPFIATAPVVLVFCVEPELNRERYAERGLHLYCIQDAAAAIENVLLTAVELGLGSCWCGGFDESKASEILNLPDGRRPVAIVPIGHAAAELPPKPGRRSLDQMVTYL
jgi:nitroreductase